MSKGELDEDFSLFLPKELAFDVLRNFILTNQWPEQGSFFDQDPDVVHDLFELLPRYYKKVEMAGGNRHTAPMVDGELLQLDW